MALCVSVAQIEQAVALQLHVMPEDIQDMTMRSDNVAEARALVALLCRECTSVSGHRSWQQIADMLGYAGHSSARRAAQSVRQRINRNPEFGETLASIRRFLSYDFSTPIRMARPRAIAKAGEVANPIPPGLSGHLNTNRRIPSRLQTPIENGQKVVLADIPTTTTAGA